MAVKSRVTPMETAEPEKITVGDHLKSSIFELPAVAERHHPIINHC